MKKTNKFLDVFKGLNKKRIRKIKKIFTKKSNIPLNKDYAQSQTKVKNVTPDEVDNLVSKLVNSIGKRFKRIFGKKDDFSLTIEAAQKRVEMKEVTNEELDNFVTKILDKIEKSGYNPSHVLNDMNALASFIREVVVDDPSLLNVADSYLVSAINRQSKGIARDEKVISELVKEFKQNPNRVVTGQNLPYDTSIVSDLGASKYVEALFRAFKDKAFEMGLNATQFRRALDDILTNEPYELYRGQLNNRGNITRNRILKPARDIVNLAIARGLGYSDETMVNIW